MKSKLRVMYQLVRKVILSVDILAQIYQVKRLILEVVSMRDGALFLFSTRRGAINATHVLSLVLSRSSFDSVISERPGLAHCTSASASPGRTPVMRIAVTVEVISVRYLDPSEPIAKRPGG
jgi:hypothetical protein